MHRPRAWPRTLAGCVALFSALLVAPATSTHATAGPDFSVEGLVEGLYPGFSGVLQANVTNPFAHSIRLMSLVSTPVPSAARCEIFLTVGQLTEEVVMAANTMTTVGLAVEFDRAAPDSCQDITIALAFAASMTGAERVGGGVLPASGVSIGRALIVVALLLGSGSVLLTTRRVTRRTA